MFNDLGTDTVASTCFSSWDADAGIAQRRSSRRKRVLDLLVAIALFVLGSPVFLAIALAIKLTSRGPVLFRQPRVGLNGATFCCYKFRTMATEATDLLAERQTVPGDPRITPVGRWLRRLSFDELPQVINVLKGEMSLVGPRPHAPATKAGGRLFADVVPGYHRRHVVRPGITGLAQISGCRGPTGHEDQILRRVHYDLVYINSMSMRLDLKILWKTATREIFSDNAF